MKLHPSKLEVLLPHAVVHFFSMQEREKKGLGGWTISSNDHGIWHIIEKKIMVAN